MQVSASQVPKLSGIQPVAARAASDSVPRSWPATMARPSSGARSPASNSSKVVLPEPLGPIRAVTAPAGASKLTPSTACTSPNHRRSPWASIPGGTARGGCAGANSSMVMARA